MSDAPFQPHSETSWEASIAIGAHLGPQQKRILEFLHRCGAFGATDGEMQDILKMNPSTQRPRRIELCQRGLVEDSGGTRYTGARRRATVWRITKC